MLDLDNTLLHNPDHAFANAYLSSLSTAFENEFGYSSIPKLFRSLLPELQNRDDHQEFNYDFMLNVVAQELQQPVYAIEDLLDVLL